MSVDVCLGHDPLWREARLSLNYENLEAIMREGDLDAFHLKRCDK